MRCMLFLVSAICLLCVGMYPNDAIQDAPEDGGPGADSARIKKHLRFLASDELAGRMSGTESERIATWYIARVFRESNLIPVGDVDINGEATYFQQFNVSDASQRIFNGSNNVTCRPRNCIGLLEGTDPVLKNEIIVIGAHHDHLGHSAKNPGFMGRFPGKEKSDPIFNGADDNASGTATLLAVAEMIADKNMKFKRSILFMTFSAEEWGLLGSRYYVKNPYKPIENHVTMINLDMVGANPGKPVNFYGLGTAVNNYFDPIIEVSALEAGLEYKLKQGDIAMGASDHFAFRSKGMPTIFLHTEGHNRYHKPEDHYDTGMDYERMAKTAGCVTLMLKKIANDLTKPEFNGDYRTEEPNLSFLEGKFADGKLIKIGEGAYMDFPALGVTLSMPKADALNKIGLGRDIGAFFVSSVSKSELGSKLGLKEGDFLLSLNDIDIPVARGLGELMVAVQKWGYVEDRDFLKAIVFRNGERVHLELDRRKDLEKKTY